MDYATTPTLNAGSRLDVIVERCFRDGRTGFLLLPSSCRVNGLSFTFSTEWSRNTCVSRSSNSFCKGMVLSVSSLVSIV